MAIAFFVSSIGDTDLAKETITRLKNQNPDDKIFIIPITAAAVGRTEDIVENDQIFRVSIDQITKQSAALTNNQIASDALQEISSFIQQHNIQRAYIGVPSVNNEIPFQIASYINIPCTIAYEYMFKPLNHVFWNYVNPLAAKNNCQFAVPLAPASKDILEKNSQANISEIGHLSIDRAETINPIDATSIRKNLSIHTDEEFVFVSGTTQPIEIDTQFLDALLGEIATGKYSNIQIRMGLHPGVKDPDTYLQSLLHTCEKYPETKNQFKIIMTPSFEKRLKSPIITDFFILRADISGANATEAADKVAQAVPGALLNESAFKGKPSYFHDKSALPYLPEKWFSGNLNTFFAAKRECPHSKQELGLKKEQAPDLLANLMRR